MLSYCLNNMAVLGDLAGDHTTAQKYRAQAKATAEAVNSLLWDPAEGHYRNSLTNPKFAYIDMAWSIISNISSLERSQSQLSKLPELGFRVGYLEDTDVVGSADTRLAPYLSGFLLESLLQIGATKEAKFLLDGVFSAMAANTPDYSGGSWEYVVSSLIVSEMAYADPPESCRMGLPDLGSLPPLVILGVQARLLR